MIKLKISKLKYSLFKYISLLSRRYRLIIMIIYDSICINFSIIFSLLLLNNILQKQIYSFNLNLLLFFTVLHILLYISLNIYKNLLEYFNSNLVYRLIFINSITIILFSFFNKLLINNSQTLNFYIITLFLENSISILPRIIIRDFLSKFNNKNNNKQYKNIVVYGAGSTGVKIIDLLNLDNTYKISFFIDDNKDLHNRFIKNIPIKSIDYLETCNCKSIDQILFAMPSNTAKQTKEVIEKISKYEIKVLNVPKLSDIVSGRLTLKDLRELTPEDIIGREIVSINTRNSLGIKNKCICITGAGGSIGQELFKQISVLNPKCVVLIDNSEYNLYKLNQFIDKQFLNSIKVYTILEDATNENALEMIFREYEVDYIFHAAAYKHVPIVEGNPLSGIRNNVFSTLSICNSAYKLSVEKVILISSDKAVRPTNIMGITKRISELIFLAYANKKLISKSSTNRTIYSMVRFGNVLNSSGSVLPLFYDQIKSGGPLTVTHQKVKRYFMTISEAAKLVIQSSEYSKGGDLFILDMGEQISIMDLAKKMVKLSGLSIKSHENPNGDIAIETTNLRPGEKLYEELLIDNKCSKTDHPLIFRAKEAIIDSKLIISKIAILKKHINSLNILESLTILKELVPEARIKLPKKNINN